MSESTEPVTRFFTFGFNHAHACNGQTLDKDSVIAITAINPREVMFELFGPKWAMEYSTLDDVKMCYYPRGVYDFNNRTWNHVEAK